MSKNILDSKDVQEMMRILGIKDYNEPISFTLPIEKFNPNGFLDSLKKIRLDGENIKQEEKPFSSTGREYNIYELETLLKNMPEDTEVEFNDYRWKLKYFDMNGRYDFINKFNIQLHDLYCISEILNAKFKLVQPKPTGKWISATKSELLQAIFDGKRIKTMDKEVVYPRENMTPSQKAEYICDRYPLSFSSNEFLIWEENK